MNPLDVSLMIVMEHILKSQEKSSPNQVPPRDRSSNFVLPQSLSSKSFQPLLSPPLSSILAAILAAAILAACEELSQRPPLPSAKQTPSDPLNSSSGIPSHSPSVKSVVTKSPSKERIVLHRNSKSTKSTVSFPIERTHSTFPTAAEW